ncbi:hypothetical protein [Kribbella sp. DT2]|uniref:hypothetical protein n=1 Tax=Kribbella sp. DT2 TaxID=3393427 RepID=UPI003CF93A75
MAKRKKLGWTAAGAARAARESRIATAGFLREAELAYEMQAHRLMDLHQVKTAHLGAGQESAALQLMVAGYGYDPESWMPANFAQFGAMVTTDQGSDLASADLYILSPQMCDVVVAAALSLSFDDLSLMAKEDLPTPRGLVVLPHPLLVRSIGGEVSDDRAFGWNGTLLGSRVDMAKQSWVREPAVRITSFYDTFGPVQPDSFRQLAARARAEKTPLPPLMLDGLQCLWFGLKTVDEQREAMDQYREVTREHSQAQLAEAEKLGLDETRMVGDYVPGAEIPDDDGFFTARFLYAFWRLCEQDIAEVSPTEVGHAARVTSERAGVPAEVRVAQLRPTARPAVSADGPDVDRWNHRWVVRMHKVRQWYPSEQRHKVIYRGPYVKGPEDKPLLGGEVVRHLTT